MDHSGFIWLMNILSWHIIEAQSSSMMLSKYPLRKTTKAIDSLLCLFHIDILHHQAKIISASWRTGSRTGRKLPKQAPALTFELQSGQSVTCWKCYSVKRLAYASKSYAHERLYSMHMHHSPHHHRCACAAHISGLNLAFHHDHVNSNRGRRAQKGAAPYCALHCIRMDANCVSDIQEQLLVESLYQSLSHNDYIV